jgi:hypothetical protein
MDHKATFLHQNADTERRRSNRREMTVLCTASFNLNEEARRAILLDLSDSGARFGSASAIGTLTFTPGQVADFELHTPFGMTSVQGKVVWTFADEVLYTWGITFTQPPELNHDPLRCLLA